MRFHVIGKSLWATLVFSFLVFPAIGSAHTNPNDSSKTVTIGSSITVTRRDVPRSASTLPAINYYYGQVHVTADGVGQFKADNRLLDGVSNFLGVKHVSTASINLTIKTNIQGTPVTIYQVPLFTLTRSNSGQALIQPTFQNLTDASVSPYFAFNNFNTEIQYSLSISQIDTTKGGATGAAATALNAVTALGGAGALLTALNEPKMLAVLNQSEAALYSAISSEVDLGISHNFQFAESVGVAGDEITIGLNDSSGSAVNYSVKVTLVPRTTLLVDNAPADGYPDLSTAAMPYADRITVDASNNTLTAALEKAGIVKLNVLQSGGQAPATASAAPTSGANSSSSALTAQQKATIEQECGALQSALTGPGSTFRLNQVDADAVLYDQLRLAGVLSSYSIDQLACTQGLSARLMKYKISLAPVPPPPHDPTIGTPPPYNQAQKEARLKDLATAWDWASANQRGQQLTNDISASGVSITAPQKLFPDAPGVPDDKGMVTITGASGAYLGKLRKTCFGNQRPTADGSNASTAFARFQGFRAVYLLTFTYDPSPNYDATLGPRIKAIKIAVPSSSDVNTYNLNGNCVH